MQPKRVIVPYTGTEIGGSHISSFTLCRALQDLGIEVFAYANKDTQIAHEAARYDLTVRELSETPAARHNLAYDLLRLPFRAHMLRQEGPGIIVHCHGMGALQSWGPAAKLVGAPLVYHNRAFNRPILANRLIMNLADKSIAISESVKKLMAFLPAGKVETIDNPFALGGIPNRSEERQKLVNELDLAAEGPIIGFVANFWERKRPFFFLDVCKVILERHPLASFVMFGRKGDVAVSAIKDYARQIGIADHLHLPGFRLPVESNIAALDLMLAPAINEPLGRTPIESLLLGTPYVATDDAGHGEIGRRWAGGRLVDKAADYPAFAAVVLDVLDHPASVLLKEDKKLEITHALSAANHATKVVELYSRLL